MLFWEIVAIYCDSRAQPVNTVCVQKARFFTRQRKRTIPLALKNITAVLYKLHLQLILCAGVELGL